VKNTLVVDLYLFVFQGSEPVGDNKRRFSTFELSQDATLLQPV